VLVASEAACVSARVVNVAAAVILALIMVVAPADTVLCTRAVAWASACNRRLLLDRAWIESALAELAWRKHSSTQQAQSKASRALLAIRKIVHVKTQIAEEPSPLISIPRCWIRQSKPYPSCSNQRCLVAVTLSVCKCT